MKPWVVSQGWREVALKNPGRIAFPEGSDSRVLATAHHLLLEGSFREVHVWLPEKRPASLADQHILMDKWEQSLHDHGKKKGLFIHPSIDLEQDLQHAAQGLGTEWDVALAGNTAPTSSVIRTGLKHVGLKEGVKTVTGSFVLEAPEDFKGPDHLKLLMFADSGVVIEPTPQQLCDAAIETVRTWEQVSPFTPRVAFLSFSTKGSAKHPLSDKVVAAVQLFQSLYPQYLSDGELQLDAAIHPETARRKAPNSPLEGKANCLIFPDLGAGNIAYKLMQQVGGYGAYGPILQGLKQPWSDLSRGATVMDLVFSSYINRLRGLNSSVQNRP